MATYEYICLSCERSFEERRPMGSPVKAKLACPNCESERVRRRFSFAAAPGATTESAHTASSGGCGCGACTCGN
ncbi:MAG TPA: zinc ribbon domain-containing protein [Actinomycetota bacterium]|jgi:putative FmdB family regulatory protein